MVFPDQVIVQHIVTEKATEATSHLNRYTFRVTRTSNRLSVREAIEKQFGVKVVSVNIQNVKPKAKRTRRGTPGSKPGYKKAVVRLKDGDTIALA